MIEELVKQKRTVFTLSEVALVLKRKPDANLISNINYYVKIGKLTNISKGLYVINKDYSRLELANKLRKPSYISFYTVLQQEGIIFQNYENIYLATNRSEEIVIQDQVYKYRKIKDDYLLNSIGVEYKDNVSIATKERALVDKIYLDGEEYFDNLEKINWDIVYEIADKVYAIKKLKITLKRIQNAE